MQTQRREFLKKALIGSSAVLATTTLAQANERPTKTQGSNGVVVGYSPKKEILYKKTSYWREYYSVAS
ncbi:MAG: Tat pathway signal protein [Epsilonproteobacteria bacterium]|nr:Tat pathway signal protein [Campylobacterota bacterium]